MVILTYYNLRTSVKQLKTKFKDKLHIKNMTFESFKILAAQFLKKNLHFIS